jgi:hypothetical protein
MSFSLRAYKLPMFGMTYFLQHTFTFLKLDADDELIDRLYIQCQI